MQNTKSKIVFYLRPTTREYVHLVTRGHSRLCDNDVGHTILSAISKNPMLHANFTALSVIEAELLPIQVFHCKNGDFRRFLLPWPWSWRDDRWNLDTYSLEMHRISENKLSMIRLSKVIVWQTDEETTEIIDHAASRGQLKPEEDTKFEEKESPYSELGGWELIMPTKSNATQIFYGEHSLEIGGHYQHFPHIFTAHAQKLLDRSFP